MTEPDDVEKKQKVIHARVPEELDRELKRKAGRLGVSVSNLVRNVLQNTFGLVEDIVADAGNIARSAQDGPLVGKAGVEPTRAAPVVLGWQVLTLNVNALCVSCNAILAKGTEAAIAVTDQGLQREFQCIECMTKGKSS